jgi:hypothetical protein
MVQNCLEKFTAEFPNVIVDRKTFEGNLSRCVKLFRETGDGFRRKTTGRPLKRTAAGIETAREIMQNAPHTSLRQLSQQTDLSAGTCHKLLRKDVQLYPYCVTVVEELLPGDPIQRLAFCKWFNK